ncbi:RNA polymerase archaeal subunit P/eukaryotic subunit RPABC4 [Moorella glycerini]|uniref:Zinc ribbon domain protein n=1 Tax=Neomoorella stamsii TaxID=1266720 RepID=A0A9X7P6H8_9FIRM|nr:MULTISPECIES: zinc ribbon domain-containing protein [Moorella]PRR73551.1 Zinc ribbon domain protein [Moorella stamsii]CEP69320.1 RNA polymerase archaeal subunit P/eukaryotic subunit RPABC4 [Moorella glycerini]
MPTYDFKCKECGHLFSQFVPIKDKDKVRCPECGGEVSQRFTGFLYVRKGEPGAATSGSSCSGGSCSSCSGCH